MHGPHIQSEPLEPRLLFASIQADAAFGRDGNFNIPYIGAHDDDVRAITVQNDGKVVIAGVTHSTQAGIHLLVGRFNANGNPDRTFGRGGKDGHGVVTIDVGDGLTVNDVVVEPKGKILVAGQLDRHMAALRLNKNGSLDESFADNGMAVVRTAPASQEFSRSEASHVLLTPNGRILLAGTAYFQSGSTEEHRVFDFAFARLRRNGSLDPSFGPGGFDGDGIATTDVDRYDDLRDVALDSQGRIVVAGDTNSETSGIGYVLLRHNADGSLDTSFSDDGILTHGGPARDGSPGTPQGSPDSSLNTLRILPGDRITAAGVIEDDDAVALVAADGDLESHNVLAHGARNSFEKIVPDPAGNGFLVLAGSGPDVPQGQPVHASLIRLNADGTARPFPKTNTSRVMTKLPPPVMSMSDVAFAPDGRIVVSIAGARSVDSPAMYDSLVARFTRQGRADKSFARKGVATVALTSRQSAIPTDVLLQEDGRILATAILRDFSPRSNLVVRLRPNGSYDRSFDKDGRLALAWPSGARTDLLADLQPGGDILLTALGDTRATMLRLNPDGSTDSSFGDDGWFETDTATYAPTALHTLPDGKMLLAGVTYYPTYPTPAIISRLNTDGSPDTAFGSGDGSTEVNIEAFHDLDRILIQEDDKILLVGSTATGTRSGSAHELPDPDVWRVSIVRLTADGDLDTSFSSDGLLRLSDLAADFVLDARLLPDDDILLLASEDSPSGDDADSVLLIRLNADGSVQSTTAPAVSDDDVRNALFDPDGNALVFTASETLRFTNDGEYDPTFSADPIRAFDRFVFDDEERLITLSDTRAGLRAARHLLT